MKFSTCQLRKNLSVMYAKGCGIEIGALHSAWPIHDNMSVRYIDRYSYDELVSQYPDLNPNDIAKTDIIGDARSLESIEDGSQDFVLTSHVLEHSDNPIETLKVWLTKTKPGGTVILAVPNKDHTFDRDRPLTPFESLIEAYLSPTNHEFFKRKCLYSYFRYVDKVEGQELSDRVARALSTDSHVHFPVWDANSFVEFLGRTAQAVAPKFQVEMFIQSGIEVFGALRRQP